jgi:hypothetical protein
MPFAEKVGRHCRFCAGVHEEGGLDDVVSMKGKVVGSGQDEEWNLDINIVYFTFVIFDK